MEQDLLRHLRVRMSPEHVRDYILHHQPHAIYIKIDTWKMHTCVHSRDFRITTFYSAPTLADAVIRARQFCRRYYHEVPVLEYNV